MSRHTLAPRQPADSTHIAVGWDRPEWTFFAQVESADGDLVVDLGDAENPVHTPGIVLDAVRDFAPIPPGLDRQLLRDAVETGATVSCKPGPQGHVMTTAPTFARAVTDIAEWLTRHATPDLPELINLTVPDSALWFVAPPSIHISQHQPLLAALADWTEYLHARAEIEASLTYLEATIIGANLPHGLRIHAYLGDTERHVLEAHVTKTELEQEIASATTLRAAANACHR